MLSIDLIHKLHYYLEEEEKELRAISGTQPSEKNNCCDEEDLLMSLNPVDDVVLEG